MDELYMKEALKEGEKAYQLDEVPVGAVIVYEGRIIARGYNKKESTNNPLDHGELIAIKEASDHLGTWRLEGCTMYVTLEPCMMCGGAIVNSRMDRLVIGARDYKRGCCGTVDDFLGADWQNHRLQVEFGVLEGQCSNILTMFFGQLRKKRKLEK